MKRGKQVNKQVNKTNYLLVVFSEIKSGLYPSQIAVKHSTTKQNISRYIARLKRLNLILKKGYGVWELTPLGKKSGEKVIKNHLNQTSKHQSSLGTRNETDLHALNLKVPIIKGNLDLIKDFNGYTQKKFNNWIPQYKKFLNPIGFTIKNNNNKSISLNIFSRRIINLNEINQLIIRTLLFVQTILKEKDVFIDVAEAEVKTFHICMKDKDLEKVLNKGTTIEVKLGRNREKILPMDNPKEAVVWTDNSPFRGRETNDIAYTKKMLLMPEKVDRIENIMVNWTNNIDDYNKNLKLHIKVQKGQLKVQKETLKTLKQIQERI